MLETRAHLDEVLYAEKQQFRQWWLWLLILIAPVSILCVIFQQAIAGISLNNYSKEDLVWIVLALILGVIIPLGMYFIRLDTVVIRSGVYIRFSPFHRNWRVFSSNNIQKAEALIYHPLRDYGGWGIRYGRKGKGKAYNVSGNEGVLLTLEQGELVLIGSTKQEALARAVGEILSNVN